MTSQRESIFRALRSLLQKHRGGLSVSADTTSRYCLEGNVGPSTLQAWRGKMKRPTIPVAWVEIGKSYVSYHLMGVQESAALPDAMSKDLRARMQGKTCFNFKTEDERLLQELDELTAKGLASFREAGFISP
jgi:hypothetical protein